MSYVSWSGTLNPTEVTPPAQQAMSRNGLAEQSPVWQSRDLFQGRQEIVIHHDGQDYRLRVTQQNKLILTK